MGVGIAALEGMHVVGCDASHAEPLGNIDQLRIGRLLLGQIMILNLDEKPIGREDRQVRFSRLFGGSAISFEQGLRHLAGQTRATAKQPSAQLDQNPTANAR